MAHLRLTIEPIPTGSRLASLAKLLPRDQWDRIRRAMYRRARYRCEACARRDRLHCHEVWHYNRRTGYQWLRGFRALCPRCHAAKHITFVSCPHRREDLLGHFMAVNRLAREEAEQHLRDALRCQRELDKRQWIISYGDYNLRMPSLADLQQRRQYVQASRSRYRG